MVTDFKFISKAFGFICVDTKKGNIMSKNCGKIGLPVKFLHLSVRIFTKWWLRKNYKWNKLEKNSVSMEEIKKGQEECSRLLEIQISLLPAPLIRAQAVDERGVCWTQGLHPIFDLLSKPLSDLFICLLTVLFRSDYFFSQLFSEYVRLAAVDHRTTARPAPHKLKDSGNCSYTGDASIFFISKTQDRFHFHLLTWKMPGSVSFLSI